MSGPPSKGSPLRVKPPASVVMRVATVMESSVAETTSMDSAWKGGGAGGGAGGRATGAGSLPPQPARPASSNAVIPSKVNPCLTTIRVIGVLLLCVLS